MGLYINEIDGTLLPAKGKVSRIRQLVPEAEILSTEPTEWREGLVCVVTNGAFDAAGYAFNQEELQAFKYPDGRPKTWMLVPNAKKLAR